jgi:hypothetical protein
MLVKLHYTYKKQLKIYLREFKTEQHFKNYLKSRQNKTSKLEYKILKKI